MSPQLLTVILRSLAAVKTIQLSHAAVILFSGTVSHAAVISAITIRSHAAVNCISYKHSHAAVNSPTPQSLVQRRSQNYWIPSPPSSIPRRSPSLVPTPPSSITLNPTLPSLQYIPRRRQIFNFGEVTQIWKRRKIVFKWIICITSGQECDNSKE